MLRPESFETTAIEGTAEGTWPPSAWWKDFNDPQLDALIDEALGSGDSGGSPSLRIANARLDRANAITGLAESAARPGVTLNASAIREKFSENYIYPPPLGGSTLTVGQLLLNFNYDLDFWGKNSATIDAAHAQARAAEVDGDASRLALTTSIARAWLHLERLYAEREITLAAVRQREQSLGLTRQRVTAGLDTNSELRQAEATVPAARVEAGQIDEAIALTRNQLAALLGKGPDRGARIQRPQAKEQRAFELPDNVALNLLGRRPDLAAARWRVMAARRDVDRAKADFYPNINLVASAGLLSLGAARFLQSSSKDASIGPALTLPIFQGSLRATLRGKDADYDIAVEQYNQTLVDALRDVADQITSLKAAHAQRADQQLARSKAEDAYAIALARYKAGISNYLTVLTAQTAVLAQQRAEIGLDSRELDLRVGLIRSLGGGFEEHRAAPSDAIH